MTSTNTVDDYYANLSSSSQEDVSSSQEDKKKTKIKAKKKVIVKKTSDAPKEDAVSESFEGEKKEDILKTPLKVKAVSPKKMIQKIEVVKMEPVESVRENRREDVKEEKKEVQNDDKTKKTFSQSESYWQLRSWKQLKTKAKTYDDFGSSDEDAKQKKGKTSSFVHQKTRGRVRFVDEKEVTFVRSKAAKRKKEEKKVEDIKQNLVDRKWQTIMVWNVLSLKEFSEKIGVSLSTLIAEFMKNGMMVNINSKIDFDAACIVADAFEIKLERDVSVGVKVEDVVSGNLESLLAEDDESKLSPRCPVVSIMGHVDHGKTSLLDYIRKSNQVAWEAGGITQSIGAYQVELLQDVHGKEGKITFLDTPGHEAFTAMRARWAKTTDIAILVVASDEGIKPQTVESINHAREANVPVIVAINKMDKEGANPDFVKGQLAEQWLTPEDWWWDTPCVPVSAHTWFWVDELLDMILLVAEMRELKANPDRKGIATVIESHLDPKLGPVATLLVNTGTIHAGDDMVCQDSFGKIKVLKNYKWEWVKFALPGEPTLVVGLDKVVEWWDILQCVASPDVAKQKAALYKEVLEQGKKAHASGLDLLMSKIQAGNLQQLKVIVKADTNGSLEAIKAALLKLSNENTSISVIHSGVWSVTEGDVLMARSSEAILIGFSVGVLPTAKDALDNAGIEYINSKIIYHITERIEKIVTGMLDTKEVEVVLWFAKIWWIFYTSKDFMVVGLVLRGFFPDGETQNKIEKGAQVRILRKDKFLWNGKIDSLKTGTLEVKELEWPTECGIKLVSNVKIELGDELEIYKMVKS